MDEHTELVPVNTELSLGNSNQRFPDDRIDLVLANAELSLDNSNLRYQIDREERRRKKEKVITYRRNRIKRSITISAVTFASIISIAVGSALNDFFERMDKINAGKKELVNRVQSECLYGINYREDSVSGLIFSIGNQYVDFDALANAIIHRANAAEISDLDLYIGISNTYGSQLASEIVTKFDREDIYRRCMEIYLEQELERIRANGK